MADRQKTSVLIIGSGPQAPVARTWGRSAFTHIAAINNAWRVRPDWDYAIYPEDFPAQNRPDAKDGQQHVTAAQYVSVQNQFGGFVYAGGTMAFTAGYWALGALRPDVMAFIGCNMVYPARGNTHFYGTGAADPLRQDPTLQSLEAKSARLEILAAKQGCACVNLSRDESRLVFGRAEVEGLQECLPLVPDERAVSAVEAAEASLGYMVPSGRYWDEAEELDAASLSDLDDQWLSAHAACVRQSAEPH